MTLQWTEPPAYRRAVAWAADRKHAWKALYPVTAIFVGILAVRGLVEFFHWTGGNYPNRPGWLPSAGIALAGAIAFGLVLPRLLLYLPNSNVILSEKGINNNVVGRGTRVTFWSWDKIGYGRVEFVDANGMEYPVLTVYAVDHAIVATLGLRAQPTPSEIAAFFRRHGKELDV